MPLLGAEAEAVISLVWGPALRPSKPSLRIGMVKIRQLLSIDSYDLLKEYRKWWVEEYLDIVQQNL